MIKVLLLTCGAAMATGAAEAATMTVEARASWQPWDWGDPYESNVREIADTRLGSRAAVANADLADARNTLSATAEGNVRTGRFAARASVAKGTQAIDGSGFSIGLVDAEELLEIKGTGTVTFAFDVSARWRNGEAGPSPEIYTSPNADMMVSYWDGRYFETSRIYRQYRDPLRKAGRLDRRLEQVVAVTPGTWSVSVGLLLILGANDMNADARMNGFLSVVASPGVSVTFRDRKFLSEPAPAPVPLPAAAPLLAAGLGALALFGRKRVSRG
jgi:hypothetical protein